MFRVSRNPEPAVDSRSWEPRAHMGSRFVETEPETDTPITAGSGSLGIEPETDTSIVSDVRVSVP